MNRKYCYQNGFLYTYKSADSCPFDLSILVGSRSINYVARLVTWKRWSIEIYDLTIEINKTKHKIYGDIEITSTDIHLIYNESAIDKINCSSLKWFTKNKHIMIVSSMFMCTLDYHSTCYSEFFPGIGKAENHLFRNMKFLLQIFYFFLSLQMEQVSMNGYV